MMESRQAAMAPEVPPSTLAAKTRSLTAESNKEEVQKQLEAERLLLSKIRKYRDLTDSPPDFDPLTEQDQERYWRILWNVMDSKSPSNMARDKKATMELYKRIVVTKSRYVGQGVGGVRLFLSQSGTLTKIVPGSTSPVVVWPSVRTLKRESLNSETRIQYLKRILAGGGEDQGGEDAEEFSEE